jgi:spermidine/putrescine transport system substrate-binding protein
LISSKTQLNLLCWEGYEADPISSRFKRDYGLQLHAQTLLSDAAIADEILAGNHPDCDILNINNAYIRDSLEPAGLVCSLDSELNQRYRSGIHSLYQRFLPWSYNSGGELIGIGQRYGPFNLVINTDTISRASAEDQGFHLANDPAFRKRYAILDYPDFNLFHVCIGAGINPFQVLSTDDIEKFERTAATWCQNALLLEADHHRLNRALLQGKIDFYISGGIYTVSPARLAGHSNLLAVTPSSGPINGKGGIAFTEITSLIKTQQAHPQAESFLRFMLEPETAIAIAFADGTCNPVAQMGDPDVLQAFSRQQLDAIQWETLDDQLQNCADYQIPPDRRQLLPALEHLKSKYR